MKIPHPILEPIMEITKYKIIAEERRKIQNYIRYITLLKKIMK